jgi:outer membrane protein OmpA-like peptidoglycan-associated protein
VSITNLGNTINSKYADYSPLISADGSFLIFTSRRAETTGGMKDESIDSYYEDIYFSEQINGEWVQAKNIGAPINTNYHDATVGLSPDGQKLFIYNDNSGSGDIYECTLEGEKWSNPVKLPEVINSKYNEYTASFSPDGNAIYFVSDKPGGIGGKDIYVSYKDENGAWKESENLGKNINTEMDEDAVFMHADGSTLYFSSQGHKSMGGYDIYKSTFNKTQKTWSKPTNLGFPINSGDDDVFFVMLANGKTAFYTSKKEGGFGDADIYRIDFNEVSDSLQKTPQLTLLKGIVVDAKNNEPLFAQIEITDNVTGNLISTFQSNATTGKYLISLPSGKNYGINVNATGYLFHSENINLPDSSAYQEIIKNITLNKLEKGAKIVLQNIFFNYNEATIKTESKSELEKLSKLLLENKRLNIEISGHTDNIGSAMYNQKLSEERAKAVVDYLVAQNIETNRLHFKGYGFEQPIATNDTEDGRQQNRRTEFKIIGK